MHASSLDLAGKLFFWSNALYVLGALLTLGCAALMVYQRRLQPAAIRLASPLLNDTIILAPAAVCLLGTVAAICFSGVILNQQRASLETYRIEAAMELSRLHRDVAADGLAARSGAFGADTGAVGRTIAFEASGSVESPRDAGLDLGVNESIHNFEGLRALVEVAPSDGEAGQFADHLLLLLIANGIDARQRTNSSVLHQLAGQPGIHIRYVDPNRGHDFAAALAGVLRGHGLQVDVAPSWDATARAPAAAKPSGQDQVMISIGPKP